MVDSKFQEQARHDAGSDDGIDDEDSGELIKRSRISPTRILFSAISCILALFFSWALVTETPRDFRSGSPAFLDNLVFFGFGAFSFWMITIGLIRQSKWQLWCGLSAIIVGIAVWYFVLPDHVPTNSNDSISHTLENNSGQIVAPDLLRPMRKESSEATGSRVHVPG